MRSWNFYLKLFLAQIFFSVIWAPCIHRALAFYLQVAPLAAIDQSNDTIEDMRFSQHILFCYGTSYLIGMAEIWLMFRMQLPKIIFPVLCIAASTLYLTVRKPEEVIVMFPSLAPYIVLIFNVLMGLIGVGMIAIRELSEVNND
jgi:hypothetical protein